MSEKFDIYQFVTDKIIAQLEQGTIPWRKPWVCAMTPIPSRHVSSRICAMSHVNGKPYSLMNQLLLDEPGEYVTIKQCEREGGRVKKGAKSKIVVFWKPLMKEVLDKQGKPVIGADGKPKTQMIPYLQYYRVFHLRDTEGLQEKYADVAVPNAENPENRKPVPLLEDAERMMQDFLHKSGVRLHHHPQDRAFYRPATDEVFLPMLDMFRTTSGYYETAFHELVHSTGHPSRLNRLDTRAAFGSEVYSKEELIAEIGSAAILNMLCIDTEDTQRNAAAYIRSWTKALQDDKRLIISAAGKAEKAIRLIMGETVSAEA